MAPPAAHFDHSVAAHTPRLLIISACHRCGKLLASPSARLLHFAEDAHAAVCCPNYQLAAKAASAASGSYRAK